MSLPPKIHNTGLLYKRGVVQQQQRQFESAVASFEEALTIDAGFVGALFNLGVVRTEREEWSKAAECFAKIIELEPKNSDAMVMMYLHCHNICRKSEGMRCHNEEYKSRPTR